MLLLRCDASAEIGTGHFFRQLALAEYAVERGMPAEIAMHDPSDGLRDQANHLGVDLADVPAESGSAEDADWTFARALERDVSAVVADGYHFPPEFYRRIEGDWTVAAVDDLAHQPFPVDVLVNVNVDAGKLDYQTRPDTTRLLGVDYTLLREQFRRERLQIEEAGGPDVPDEVSRTLVFMGGGDPTNETAKVLRGLGRAGYGGELTVLVGASNPHESEIRRLGAGLDASVDYRSNVSEMAEMIAGHHLSFNAGGGTSWEMCCLGVPMIQTVIADNQREIVQGLACRQISVAAGWHEEVTPDELGELFGRISRAPERRQDMVERSMQLIDGRGVERILSELVSRTEVQRIR